MQTSDKGVASIIREEGVVLRAYRDVAGVWTIGAGLTAASGVITPKAGMVITDQQATALLARALAENYEPAVRRAMPKADQPEFDGAVSFHFNTGAIGRASWVQAWLKGDWDGVRSGLLQWVRGGGKVLPALKRRREAEYRIMRYADYGQPLAAASRSMTVAGLAVSLSDAEIHAMRAALKSLGFDPGADIWPASRAAVTSFQAAHGLTVDGIIGKATLSTLQRRLDARTSTVTAGSAGAAAGADAAVNDAMPDIFVWAVIAGAALWLAWTAWRYRDVIAAKIATRLPRIAAYLRSL